MDLFVRATQRDNRLIEELTAPARSGLQLGPRVPLRGLVVDAPTAAARDDLRQTAEAAGIPFLVDPLTNLLQDRQAPDHPWAMLPFAHPEPVESSILASGPVQDELIDRSIRFQLEHGVSALVAPYLFAKSTDDRMWDIQISLNKRLAAYLYAEGITLPIYPVLAASLHGFGPQKTWHAGIDTFMSSIANLNVRSVALALSASRSPKGDSKDRLGSYLSTVRHLAAHGSVIAWRQGQYGLAALAAGANGYQTGAASDDRCDFGAFNRNRRPRPEDKGERNFGTQKQIYLSSFGRSVPAKTAEVLLNSRHLRGTLVCADASCCPSGVSSMFDEWRQHGLRTRARQIEELRAMPNAAWRLNYVAREAEHSAADARVANQVLADAGVPERVPEVSFKSLAEVADALRADEARRAG